MPLTAREFDLLIYLVRRAGQVVSKRQILAGVWDDDFDGDPNVVEVYVARLRRKLDGPAGRAPHRDRARLPATALAAGDDRRPGPAGTPARPG